MHLGEILRIDLFHSTGQSSILSSVSGAVDLIFRCGGRACGGTIRSWTGTWGSICCLGHIGLVISTGWSGHGLLPGIHAHLLGRYRRGRHVIRTGPGFSTRSCRGRQSILGIFYFFVLGARGQSQKVWCQIPNNLTHGWIIQNMLDMGQRFDQLLHLALMHFGSGWSRP